MLIGDGQANFELVDPESKARTEKTRSGLQLTMNIGLPGVTRRLRFNSVQSMPRRSLDVRNMRINFRSLSTRTTLMPLNSSRPRDALETSHTGKVTFGSKAMVPSWGRCTTQFGLFWWGLGCSLGVRDVDPWPGGCWVPNLGACRKPDLQARLCQTNVDPGVLPPTVA